MASTVPFTPHVSVTTAASSTQANITVLGSGHYIRIVNAGGGIIYVGFYEPSQSPPTLASSTAMLIPAGAIEVFSVPSDTTRIALLGDASGATVNITRGEGQ